ncbi:MAG: EscU/YscU/HrcU family type III secretion system export apparatus switch protein [Candidatus Caenarcaniphilales bacterium]|nr:EscU/YscU/HrcU family type III secretion system export apparatus switch protein [Candidatus Caenarcaniphilales bacterium]
MFQDKSDKTEKASGQKLKKARDEGQVAMSQDLASSLAILIGTIMLSASGVHLIAKVSYLMRHFIGKLPYSEVSSSGYFNIIKFTIFEFLELVTPLIITLWLVAFVATIAQVKFHISFKKLTKFDLNAFNPVNGMSKLFSTKKVITTSISLTKMTVVSLVAFSIYMNSEIVLKLLKPMDLVNIFHSLGKLATDLNIKVAFIIFILSIVDYIYQKWQFAEDQKMSKQDVKEEHKQQEGSPEIKGAVKRKQHEAARRGLKSEVEQSDVVVTNPIHLAVAIKYDKNGIGAPIVTGKGSRLLAERIKEFAKNAPVPVPIVQNIPLARALYKDCHVGHEISPDLYVAVAEVLAFVYKQKGQSLAS